MINGIPFGLEDNFTLPPSPFNAVLDTSFDDGSITEPVTLSEAKLWCKIDVSEDDSLITALITTARQMCETYACISIISRTVTAVINNSCGGQFLPYGPVKSITSVTDGNGQTIATTDYCLSGLKFKQILTPKYYRMTIVYTTGYETLPQEFKNAIMQQVFFLYENRGEYEAQSRTGTAVVLGLSSMAKTILKPLKRSW